MTSRGLTGRVVIRLDAACKAAASPLRLHPSSAALGSVMAHWFIASWPHLVAAMASAALIYICVIVYARFAGVRSFAKMSGFDFAMTIAVGSVIASTALSASTPLPVGAAVLGGAVRDAVGHRQGPPALAGRVGGGRQRADPRALRGRSVDRQPPPRGDVPSTTLWSKMREANVLRRDYARAVIVETTGDVTVLHGDPSHRTRPHALPRRPRPRCRLGGT